MRVTFQFGHGVICLPEQAAQHLKTASGTYYKVLLYLAASPHGGDIEKRYAEIARATGTPPDEVSAAIIYWLESGLISEETAAEKPAKGAEQEPKESAQAQKEVSEKTKKTTLSKLKEHPDYNGEEIARLYETSSELKALVDECQRMLGKVFSAYELNTIISFYDYLGLSAEYILMLLAYCKRKGKTAIRYIERTAISLLDEGIDSVGALASKIETLDRMDDISYQVRRLFGLGERALTAKETNLLEKWTNQWQMSFEMIRYAYELMIESGKVNKPSFAYAGAIMERWYQEGLKTVEQVEASQAAFHRENGTKKAGAHPGGKPAQRKLGNFDVDEFLQLALKRSYQDMPDHTEGSAETENTKNSKNTKKAE